MDLLIKNFYGSIVDIWQQLYIMINTPGEYSYIPAFISAFQEQKTLSQNTNPVNRVTYIDIPTDRAKYLNTLIEQLRLCQIILHHKDATQKENTSHNASDHSYRQKIPPDHDSIDEAI